MKAIVYQKYGPPDVLQLAEVEKPAPSNNEVLVKVKAASVNPYDWHYMTGLPYIARPVFGLFRPKVNRLGADLAGQVEAVGENVTQFHPDDEVYGEVTTGGCAEYICVSEDSVVPKPANLTFEQAAAVPMVGLTALQGLRDHGQVSPGQKVLINGASGGVGTFAVQVAKNFGAEVTGVCSTTNVDMVRSLGADLVVDYTREDFTRGGERYDLMLDNVGNRSPSECRRVLKPGGVYLSSFGLPARRWLGPMAQLLGMVLLSLFVSQKMISFTARTKRADLLLLNELLESGKVTPVIDRTYPLSEAAEAMRYLETERARGKVVITI